jgi:integrating conjugative element protein (TIGR03765 family)
MAAPDYQRGHQALTVIYQGPRVIAAAPFYSRLGTRPTRPDITPALLRHDKVARQHLDTPATSEDRFPLRSEALAPGAPRTRSVERLYRPFFVLGMDPASLAWLQVNAEQLAQQGAFGLVVEAAEWNAWQALKRAAASQGIALSLMPGDALAGVYGIRTYPTLFVRSR